MKRLRVGVVGVGHIGKNHARLYAEQQVAEFAAIYDTDHARAQQLAQEYGTTAAASLEEFAERVDAASVATPTSTHFDVAMLLLERGKHLLIEKPITDDTTQASELARVAAEHQLVLQVGHVERFNPALSALEARLTHPRFIEAHRLSPYPNRSTDIGVVLDLMIHDLEIILHLVRSPVQTIDAVGVPVLSRGEDIANARIRFENGCIANITSSRISPERMRKIRVFQEDAYLSLDYQNQSGEIYRRTTSGITREDVEIERGEPLKRQLASFVECAATGRMPKVSGDQATAALELAVEITRRLTSGFEDAQRNDVHPGSNGSAPPASGRSIYFVAGEASGDTHGASLMKALRKLQPELQFIGRGGHQMKEVAGSDFVDWSERSAVVGLWDVLKQYGYFRKEFAATIEQIRARRPDAVVLIDYPGFNLRLACELRRQFPQLRIIYYISPQVWAWNRRRIPKMASCLDLMLCIFPFEAELYNQSGLRTVFVGHPIIEGFDARRSGAPRDPQLVGLFPGSRRREIRHILPPMLAAAERIHQLQPETHFEIAASSHPIGERIWSELRRSRLPRDVVHVTVGEAAAAMQRAAVGMVASGTATLEAACFRLPFVLVYRLPWLSYVPARMVIKVNHLGMPNVMAGRTIVPEFIQHEAKPAKIAEAVLHLLSDPAAREQMVREFDEVVATLGSGDASREAARAIVQELGSR